MLLSASNLKKMITADKNERRILKYKLLNRIAEKNGWRLHSPRFAPWDDADYNKILNGGGYGFNDKKYMIYQLAYGVAQMDGDTAECGVFKGYGSWLILNAQESKKHTHHVFDSFEGVSEPMDIDNGYNDPNAYQWKKHDMAYPLERVKDKFKEYSNVAYYKGWIPDRFAEVKDRQFKFVHVDVDLYQPTLDSFEFFYDRMLPGGVILCDDYACPGTPGAYQAVNDFLKDKKENVVTTVPGSGFFIKQ